MRLPLYCKNRLGETTIINPNCIFYKKKVGFCTYPFKRIILVSSLKRIFDFMNLSDNIKVIKAVGWTWKEVSFNDDRLYFPVKHSE